MSPESPEQAAAFEMWAKMGKNRGLRKVARQLGKAPTTVLAWSQSYGWNDRLISWEIELRERQLEKAKLEYFSEMENLKREKYTILSKMQAIANRGGNDMYSLAKYLNAIKTELGEPTTITKGTINADRANPFAGLLAKFFPAADADVSAG